MTLIMGLVSNRAYAIAPGLGINAVVAFQLVATEGLTMKSAMGIIVMEGIVITILVLTGFRKAIFKAIPLELKKAIVIGIGFFILFIGLVDGGIVIAGSGTPVTLGDLTTVPVAVTAFGVLVTIIMMARKWKGAILFGIILSTILAIILNYAYDKKPFGAVTAVIPKHGIQTPDFSLVGAFDFGVLRQARRGVRHPVDLQHHAVGLLRHHGHPDRRRRPGRLPRQGRQPAAGRTVRCSSTPLAAVGGGVVSSSSATTYIESGAGVGVGGRTGWVGVIVALCFFAAMPFSPIAGIVPASATAPALIIVGYLMMRTLTEGEAEGRAQEGSAQGASRPSTSRDLAFGLPAVLHDDPHAAHLQHHQRHRRRLPGLRARPHRPRQVAQGALDALPGVARPSCSTSSSR